MCLTTFFSPNLQSIIKNIFTIKNIYVTPTDFYVNEINYLYNRNIFKIDGKILDKIYSNNPALKSFQIKRIYPNTLKIKFIKSKPIAKIYINNKIKYLGDNGKVFQVDEKKNSIPSILGENDIQKILEIFKLIKSSSFDIQNIKNIKIYPTKRFDLILQDKTIIKFPIKTNQRTIKKAYYFLINHQSESSSIDLRLPNRIIIND